MWRRSSSGRQRCRYRRILLFLVLVLCLLACSSLSVLASAAAAKNEKGHVSSTGTPSSSAAKSICDPNTSNDALATACPNDNDAITDLADLNQQASNYILRLLNVHFPAAASALEASGEDMHMAATLVIIITIIVGRIIVAGVFFGSVGGGLAAAVVVVVVLLLGVFVSPATRWPGDDRAADLLNATDDSIITSAYTSKQEATDAVTTTTIVSPNSKKSKMGHLTQ